MSSEEEDQEFSNRHREENIITAVELAKHNTCDSLWVAINGKVYDLTNFLDDHPGGDEILKDLAGRDATTEFDDTGHSEDAIKMMAQYLIGTLTGVPPKVNPGKPAAEPQPTIGPNLFTMLKSAEPQPTIGPNPFILLKKRERETIRHWMDTFEFAKLKDWLNASKKQLKARSDAGEVPVVGWLQLASTIQTREAFKTNLEAELEQITKEKEQLDEQIRKLQQKQETLGNRKQEVQVKIKKLDEIAALQAERESIAFLGQKEEESLAKLNKKMKNPYFMEDLDADDVSTVFSLLDMDSLFLRYKQNDQYKNLEVTASTAVSDLQKDLKLDFSEAAEMVWRLKLLEIGETGCARHLSKCSICSSTTPGMLLQEYGMRAEEREKIEAKIKGWKGYYFAVCNIASAAAELNVEAALAPKLATCWMRIQKVHQWSHPD